MINLFLYSFLIVLFFTPFGQFLRPNTSNNLYNFSSQLIYGSILFGAGWGLGGLCPGPAISSLALLNWQSILFVTSMFIGFYLVKLFDSITQAR